MKNKIFILVGIIILIACILVGKSVSNDNSGKNNSSKLTNEMIYKIGKINGSYTIVKRVNDNNSVIVILENNSYGNHDVAVFTHKSNKWILENYAMCPDNMSIDDIYNEYIKNHKYKT